MERIRMKDLPSMDHPYGKCLCHGPEGLADAELLIVIIRTGNRDQPSLALSEKLLALGSSGDGLLGFLHHSLNDFMKIKGVGKVKGVQLLCIGGFSRRIWKRRARVNPISFGNPQEISDYYVEDMHHLEQEEIRVMFLNTRQVLIEDHLISGETVNISVTTPRETLIEVLRCYAVPMVLMHNHSSGNPVPNKADRMLTERIKEAGALIGITLIDHIVIGDRCYLSSRKQKVL